MTLPEATTPEVLARRMGWSERRVRDFARRLGACRILGNRMILLPEDVEAILEATKCPSPSTAAAGSGIPWHGRRAAITRILSNNGPRPGDANGLPN